MTSPTPLGAPDSPRAPSTPDAVPTWRDLPEEPPYGQVTPPRTRHLGAVFPTVTVDADSAITPGQIALAVGGLVLLAAIGIGAALLLLGEDDPAVAEVPTVEEQSGPTEDTLILPPPTLAPQPEPQPQPQQPAPQAPQGELLPQEPPGQPDPGPIPSGEPGGEAPAPDALPPDALPPDALPPGPDPADPGAPDEGDVDLPRLFRLRTLPSGMSEDATTVRQTTRDDEVVTEQITMLTAESGEIGVRASRSDDVAGQLDELVAGDGVEEVSVRGLPAYLVDDHRLVWLLPGDTETLIEIDAPPDVGTDALLTIAQGLELLR